MPRPLRQFRRIFLHARQHHFHIFRLLIPCNHYRLVKMPVIPLRKNQPYIFRFVRRHPLRIDKHSRMQPHLISPEHNRSLALLIHTPHMLPYLSQPPISHARLRIELIKLHPNLRIKILKILITQLSPLPIQPRNLRNLRRRPPKILCHHLELQPLLAFLFP